MHDVLCRLAIDGVLEMRARGLPESYVQAAIDRHHKQLCRMTLLWVFYGPVILVGVMRARWS